MLEITVSANEVYDPKTNRFFDIPPCTLTLEHSLISIAKWESKWKVPYLNTNKTAEQTLDYIRCMVVGQVKDERVFSFLSASDISKIQSYMEDSMTATTFSKSSKGTSTKKAITAESLYCRMFEHNIPMECQKWHLNRLFTLIKVCDLEKGPSSKMNKRQTAAYYAEQNALRRSKYKSRG